VENEEHENELVYEENGLKDNLSEDIQCGEGLENKREDVWSQDDLENERENMWWYNVVEDENKQKESEYVN